MPPNGLYWGCNPVTISSLPSQITATHWQMGYIYGGDEEEGDEEEKDAVEDEDYALAKFAH